MSKLLWWLVVHFEPCWGTLQLKVETESCLWNFALNRKHVGGIMFKITRIVNIMERKMCDREENSFSILHKTVMSSQEVLGLKIFITVYQTGWNMKWWRDMLMWILWQHEQYNTTQYNTIHKSVTCRFWCRMRGAYRMFTNVPCTQLKLWFLTNGNFLWNQINQILLPHFM
jgi:hypothetical protein